MATKKIVSILSSELASIKLECASLSNEVREWISNFENEVKDVCETIKESMVQTREEKEEAITRYLEEEKRRRQVNYN